MQFCPKCGRLMLPKKVKETMQLVCSSCNYAAKDEKAGDYSVVKKTESQPIVKKTSPSDDILIIDDNTRTGLPTARANCPSCGHDKAYWWMRQTRSADEPTTRFYRCVKCGKVWREYA